MKDPGHCCTIPWGVRAHGILVKTKTLLGNLQQTIENKALCSNISRWKVRKSLWDYLLGAGIQVLWLWMEQQMRNIFCLLLIGERLPLQKFTTLNRQLVQSEGWQGLSSSRRSSRAAGTKERQAAFHNWECLMWGGRAKLWDPDSLGILNQIGQNYAGLTL